MSTNALNTSHAGYPTEHTPEARAVLTAALRHEKELAQESASRSGMDLLEAIRTYRASLAPKSRYRITTSCEGVAPTGAWVYIADERAALVAGVRSRDLAEKIAAALNAQEPKP